MEKGTVIAKNHRKLENLVIIFLIIVYLILSEGADIPLIIISVLFIIIGLYLSYSIFFLTGLKLLKIESVSKNKIYIYMLSMLILYSVFNSLYFTFFEISPNIIFIFRILNFATNFIFTVIFFKYYFLLSTKQTLQLFLYLAILSFILITLINKLLFF